MTFEALLKDEMNPRIPINIKINNVLQNKLKECPVVLFFFVQLHFSSNFVEVSD
jgi:hypothetical protein